MYGKHGKIIFRESKDNLYDNIYDTLTPRFWCKILYLKRDYIHPIAKFKICITSWQSFIYKRATIEDLKILLYGSTYYLYLNVIINVNISITK